VPPCNWLLTSLPFKDFLASDHLRILAIPNLEPCVCRLEWRGKRQASHRFEGHLTSHFCFRVQILTPYIAHYFWATTTAGLAMALLASSFSTRVIGNSRPLLSP
jgi:hypothetical protein